MRVSSALGFAVWATVLGGLGYFFWTMDDAQQETRRLRESLARFMSQERIARFKVEDVREDADGHKTWHLLWRERRAGGETTEKKIVITGDQVYFDTLQINFDPRFVQEGDPLRGKSLILLRRVYALEETEDGGLAIPEGGVFNLDVPSSISRSLKSKSRQRLSGVEEVPQYFQDPSSGRTELERRLWSKIWELATDPQVAARESVHATQQKAVSTRLVVGKEYHLKLSPTGQLDIRGPIEPGSRDDMD